MNASVVICAHTEQRWHNLLAAVESVEAQTHHAHEIIVVIDHNPVLFERASIGISAARVVENTDTRGLGGARNSGVEHAVGDVVVFIDDDAVASPGWLAAFADAYRDDTVVGVGGGIEPAWEHGRPDWYPPEFDWTIGCSYLGMPTAPAEVRNLVGCNMSYRRDAVEAAGRFRLGYGCDETEFCIRLGAMLPESRLVYLPGAKVRHYVPGSRGTLKHFLTRCRFEGGSKAVVARLAGATRGLESERAYTRRVLPAGVLRGVKDLAVRRDPAGGARAAAIVAGFAATVLGYAEGTVRI
nr:glycosyltransferase family 2 protein [Solirubrobacterales bacterium]